jgi:hypothetical protein
MKQQTVLVCPDTHFGYTGALEGGVDPRSWSCFLQAIAIVRPQTFLHIGDVGEWETVSHWRWRRRKRPPVEYIIPDLIKEATSINAHLDILDEALDKVDTKKKHMLFGNHEGWLNNFIEEHPYLAKEYNPSTLMRLKERGYTHSKCGEYYRIGDLNFAHGEHYGGVNHTRALVLGVGANCMVGHWHDQQVTKIQRLGGLFGAWSIGTLCKLNKPFMGGKPCNWAGGFAIIHFESNGNFNVEQVEIHNGICWVYGHKVTSK